MRALIQRVTNSSVEIDGKVYSSISKGLLILLGVKISDTEEDAIQLSKKCCQLRIFEDENFKMNRSVIDIAGEVLIVSQFTLYADTSRGLRPGFEEAAKPELAEKLYLKFVEECKLILGNEKVKTGNFRAMMNVKLSNDGPVTILVESKINQT